ncbi:MAG: BON domain-containing protein [Planctomycetaceae bacterium]|nr:BON domain-containing protein [Planctomycetaceae bacterium]
MLTIDQTHTAHIQAAAEQHFREDSHLRNQNVACEYHEGVLVLRGRVTCYYHKQVAQTVAASISGVEQVINNVEVVRNAS